VLSNFETKNRHKTVWGLTGRILFLGDIPRGGGLEEKPDSHLKQISKLAQGAMPQKEKAKKYIAF